MTTKEYTWADLEAAIGQDFSGGESVTALEPVEWVPIRRYCEPLEMDCPLFFDAEVARKYGYRDIIAPYSGYGAVSGSGVWNPGDSSRWDKKDKHADVSAQQQRGALPLPMPRTTAGAATDIEIEYFEPVCVGDRLTRSGNKLISVAVRETSVGYGAFCVRESEVRNQRGALVSLNRLGSYSYNPHPPEKIEEMRRQREASRQAAAGTPAGERAAAYASTLFASPAKSVDWSKQRYWEEVQEGDEVPGVGVHLSVKRMVMLAGANRDFAQIHHDTVVAQEQGAPEMYINNGSVQGLWERTVREYMGLAGRVKKVGPFRMNIFNEAGFTVVTKGRVARKWQEAGQNLVELEMWSVNDRGVSVGPGPVVVTLPSRSR